MSWFDFVKHKMLPRRIKLEPVPIQSEFSLLIANCFTNTVMRICVFIKTTDVDTVRRNYTPIP